MTGITRITSLTDDQKSQMAPFAQEWIARGHRTRPLTEDEWQVWEDGVRACYGYAGKSFPGVVVRVPSPLVGAFAAPIAAHVIAQLRNRDVEAGAVGGAVHGAFYGAVGAVRDAVGGAVGDAVDDAVHWAVHGAVDGAVGEAVRGAVREAVDAVRGAVDAVGGAVDDAVGEAVRGAVEAVGELWSSRFGGIHWAAWWNAYPAYFRDICGLELPGDLWDRSRAFDAAQSAGWWWPFTDFVMVCDAPTTLHLEQVAPTGWGSHRLHCEDGPAVAWPGWGLHFWHGTRVPEWVITDPTPQRIAGEENSEIRRCAIESLGWDRYIEAAGLTLVGSCPDPGNAPHSLALYDVPEDIYGTPVRVLLMTNGSPDRSGAVRRYGETVPADINDPLAAAAWQYEMPVAEYAQLVRRT